mmetsp:Transcript_11368/g.12626  ORF Transcript_11368/g.12626 Transcript_11368/m.12626 type:complete len:326 (-) Transcript_11368:854-1831(-)
MRNRMRRQRQGNNDPINNDAENYNTNISESSTTSTSGVGSATFPSFSILLKQRSEILAWTIVCLELVIILCNRRSWLESGVGQLTVGGQMRGSVGSGGNINNNSIHLLSMNDHSLESYEQIREQDKLVSKPFYDKPVYYQSSELVKRVWHSNGSPYVNPNLKTGSCWCGADEWCMCTASMAIDCILTSGPDHFWLVKRKDTGQYATMGGFVEVGETTSEAVIRELKEEMNIEINQKPELFGVYSDPKRDARRHTASIVYIVDIPEEVVATAGDDAAKVSRVHTNEISNLDFFADHKLILSDYIELRKRGSTLDVQDPIKRDICLK